jgi:GNAT superfamily N-acetyltransferase
MDVKIKEVLDRKELKAFINFPFSLYKHNSYWVPTLISDELNTLRHDKNPAFELCEARYWLAFENNQIVGRVAAILDRPHNKRWGESHMRFGWLDFIDKPEVSEALLESVENWARECGLTAVHGPLGFTDLDRGGMLVDGFDCLSTLATIYNYPYYPIHMERLGYVKDIDWVEYEISMSADPNEKIIRMADIVVRRNKLKLFVAKNKKVLLGYAKELFDLLCYEYRNLYGFVPLSEKQVDAYIKQYFGFIRPEFVPLVLDENGKMVAFGIALPSLSLALQKAKGKLFPLGFIHLLKALNKNERADLYLVAVKSEYQGKGVNAILMNHMSSVFQKLGIKKIETNPELETNRLVQGQWKYFDARQHKRRRVFIKHISEQRT